MLQLHLKLKLASRQPYLPAIAMSNSLARLCAYALRATLAPAQRTAALALQLPTASCTTVHGLVVLCLAAALVSISPDNM